MIRLSRYTYAAAVIEKGNQDADNCSASHQHKAGGEGVCRQIATRQLGVLLLIIPAIHSHFHLLLKEGREFGARNHFLVLVSLQSEGLQILKRTSSLVLGVLALDVTFHLQGQHP